MTAFDGKCQNLQKTPTQFALDLTVPEILKFKCLTLKVDVGHVIQFSHSKASDKIYKRPLQLCARYYHLRYIKMLTCRPSRKVGKGNGVKFDGKCQNLQT